MPRSRRPSDPNAPRPRLPPSLRIPSSSMRKASNPLLSLVFASSASAAIIDPSSSSSASRGAEEALSRQLDGDLGGRQMGLRSRRSSSATIRTIHTIRGEEGSQSPRESIMEEEGDVELEPESESSRSGASASGGAGAEARGRLNPKASSSWLRWNSPTPSFPKTPSKGKGKEREVVRNEDTERIRVHGGEADTQPTLENGVPATSPALVPTSSSAIETTTANPPKPPEPASVTLQPGSVPDIAGVPPFPSQPASIGRSRGWWGLAMGASSLSRSTGAAVNKLDEENGLPVLRKEATTDEPRIPLAPSVLETRVVVVGETESIAPAATLAVVPSTTTTSGPTTESSTENTEQAPPPVGKNENAELQENKGWRGYIGWGRGPVQPVPVPQIVSPEAMAADVRLEETIPAKAGVDDQAQLETVGRVLSAVAAAEASPTPAPDLPVPSLSTGSGPDSALERDAVPVITQTPQVNKPGWGSFLYSVVVPQLNTPTSGENARPPVLEPPVAPATSQPADQLSTSKDSPKNSAVTPQPGLDPSPAPMAPIPTPVQTPLTSLEVGNDIPSSSASLDTPHATPSRKASYYSTAGWLNYLAFRASQKRIPAGSNKSVITDSTVEPPKKDGQGTSTEEVMDFSSDPDFPGVPPAPVPVIPATASKGQAGKMPPPQSTTPLPLQKKRLSNASAKSASSGITPIPPSSPSSKGRNPADTLSTTQNRPQSKSGSSLPAPPQAPAVQPNFVIPTFDSTFNRPPRSLPPLPPKAPQSEASVSSTAGGLAWRAIGAMGSYVYGSGGGGDPQANPRRRVAVEDEAMKQETRGKKEGRGIGADLPRRLGLYGDDPNEGWKSVKRVVVVGVHGWFPAKMLHSVIGEPTGTSMKFATMMGNAVTKFFEEKGVTDIRLTLMPLEGEGSIDQRVDKLFKAYLANPAWINDLRRADAIFFAAHSQGCIVTTHLISRLINQGHIRTPLNPIETARCQHYFGLISLVPPEEPRRGARSARPSTVSSTPSTRVAGADGGYQKVCLLDMCGVHLGPLYSLGQSTVIQPYLWFENPPAKELFEFQESGSKVSQEYQAALSQVLENEVKVVLISSLNDQVVPIYGSAFTTANHPLLLRALFVDGASYSKTDFITQLLTFAFLLRNAGLDDQHLIEHLSDATAGSLTGIGHSSPYEEIGCYSLAVQYLFCSDSGQRQSIASASAAGAGLKVEGFSAREPRNDFELPWIMRALVDSKEVGDLFGQEVKELKEGIAGWKPTTRALKEIKRRLEPMAGRQSKLRALASSPSSTSLSSDLISTSTSTPGQRQGASANGDKAQPGIQGGGKSCL